MGSPKSAGFLHCDTAAGLQVEGQDPTLLLHTGTYLLGESFAVLPLLLGKHPGVQPSSLLLEADTIPVQDVTSHCRAVIVYV